MRKNIFLFFTFLIVSFLFITGCATSMISSPTEEEQKIYVQKIEDVFLEKDSLNPPNGPGQPFDVFIPKIRDENDKPVKLKIEYPSTFTWIFDEDKPFDPDEQRSILKYGSMTIIILNQQEQWTLQKAVGINDLGKVYKYKGNEYYILLEEHHTLDDVGEIPDGCTIKFLLEDKYLVKVSYSGGEKESLNENDAYKLIDRISFVKLKNIVIPAKDFYPTEDSSEEVTVSDPDSQPESEVITSR